MNTIAKILLYLAKALNYWFLVIPIRFSFIAFIGYNTLIYFIAGSFDVRLAEKVVNEFGINSVWLVFGLGLPYFISFFSMFAVTRKSSENTSSLDKAIEYRNGQMSVKTDKEAFEIYKKTTLLDVMKANKDEYAYKQAIKGFNATSGNDTPQKVLRDYMK